MGEVPTIVHLDADAFFVACEQARDPSLRGKKCAVGGTQRGIISSASYEARACGVYTPMPTVRALKVCPDLVLIAHTMGLYGEVSRKMFDLCETVTPLVQRNSIDEGYLDLRPCAHRDTSEAERVVKGLQARILGELGIPVSMGIARNKLVAQIASKHSKPRGFVVVHPGQEAAFLAPLPIGKLPGIGVKTEAVLKGRGIHRVADILSLDERGLREAFGSGWQEMVAMAKGIDQSTVTTDSDDPKSYSKQETFAHDMGDFDDVVRVAKGMVDELMADVRADAARVKTITVKVRYPDFSHESHGKSLEEATDLEAPFYPHVASLLRRAWSRRGPIRLVSVKLSGVHAPEAQLAMFAQQEERRRRLAGVVDGLNRKGADIIVRGHQLNDAPRGNRK
jgi:DNA polymerase IV